MMTANRISGLNYETSLITTKVCREKAEFNNPESTLAYANNVDRHSQPSLRRLLYKELLKSKNY